MKAVVSRSPLSLTEGGMVWWEMTISVVVDGTIAVAKGWSKLLDRPCGSIGRVDFDGLCVEQSDKLKR